MASPTTIQQVLSSISSSAYSESTVESTVSFLYSFASHLPADQQQNFINYIITYHPDLVGRIGDAFQSGDLTSAQVSLVAVLDAGGDYVYEPATATSAAAGSVSIPTPSYNSNYESLVELMSHEIRHAQYQDEMTGIANGINANLRANQSTAFGNSGNATSYAQDYSQALLTNEATAYIQEWNDFVSYMKASGIDIDYSNPTAVIQAAAQLLSNSRSNSSSPDAATLAHIDFFFTWNSATQSYQWNGGYQLTATGQIDSGNSANITAMERNFSQALFHLNDGTGVSYNDIESFSGLYNDVYQNFYLQNSISNQSTDSVSTVIRISFSAQGINYTGAEFLKVYTALGFDFPSSAGKWTGAYTIVNTDTGESYSVNPEAPGSSAQDVTVVTPANGQYIISSYQMAADRNSGAPTLRGANGQVLQTAVITNPPTALIPTSAYGAIGGAIGSALGNYLADGNQVEGIVYGSVLGLLGTDLGSALAGGTKDLATAMPWASTDAFEKFAGQAGLKIFSAAVGTVSSVLVMDLANDLGINGWGAQLLTKVGSAEVSAVATQVLTNLSNNLGPFQAGFSSQVITSSANDAVVNAAASNGAKAAKVPVAPLDFGKIAENAIGSFLGTELGELVIQPQTQAGVLLSGLGSSIGAILATNTSGIIGSAITGFAQGVATSLSSSLGWLSNIIAPGIGSFIGFVLGAFIGDLFGQKAPAVPSAGAQTVLSLPYAQYKIGTVASSNGGSTDIVVQMAQTAAQTLNGLIEQVTGGGIAPHFVANGSSPTQTYGYTGSQLYVSYSGTQHDYSNADQTVTAGVMWALPQTEIIGGDIFAKRAIKNSTATDITTLLGDIQTAKDYGTYVTQRNTINSYIQSAYGTLTLDEQAFYAANKTLVDQVDLSGVSSLNSGQLVTYDANEQTISDILTAIRSQSMANPWIITLQRVNELGLDNWSSSDFYGGVQGFLQSFGMGQVDSTAHYEDVKLGWDGTNLTITDAAAPGLFSILDQASTDGTSVIVNNFNTVMSGSAGVGWNILIGGNSGNTLTASDTDSWIQGGAGTDILRGGGGHDVIVAGSGSTTIYGGNGDSYLAAGSANGDQVYGGSGNDTIFAGTGTGDTLSGGAGNDTFILSGISGSGSIDGGSGSNTVSFERYASGVNVNLGNWAAGSGSAYTEANIQNLIGSEAGGNRLQTGSSGGTLEGGAGNDTFIGGGGATTVSFANSGAGILIDLSANFSAGGSSNGDTFTNVQNIIGSAFDDELKGLAGSTLNGGSGGDDWFDYSGGGNSYIGSQGGTNTLDYSEAPAAVTVNFTTDVAQVSGETADSISNITRLIGSPDGTSVTAFPGSSQTISSTGAQLTSTQTGLGLYFIPTGGTNTLISNGSDTVELDSGGGQTTVTAGVLGYMDNTIAFGSGTTYDDIWVSMQLNESTTQSSGVGGGGGGLPGKPGSGPGQFQTFSSYNWTWGIRGGSDEVIFKSSYSSNPTSETVHDSTPTTLDMDGASTLDLSGIEFVIGETITNSSSGGTTTQTRSGGGSSQTFASTVNGYDGGSSVIITGGQASIINVDGGAAVTNGSVVIAGQAGSAGIAINTSSGDDQITYERGDGKYTITGTGGQKTIDFGPSVGSDDVIYRVIGNDLYIGLQDLSNTALTADQVSDSIRIVGGANYTANPYYIEVAGSTINLSTLTTIDWTGGSVNVTEMTTNNSSVAVSNTTVNVNSGLTGLVQGNTDTINAGTGSTITVNGTGNTVNSESGSVTLSAANASLTLVGESNTLSATGSGDTLVVYGYGTTVSASSTIINDATDMLLTVTGTSDTIDVNVGGATVTSSNNTIVYNDPNLTGTITGNSDTINLTQSDEALNVTGAGEMVNASTGSQVTITSDWTYGNRDYLYLSSGTLHVSANSNAELLNGNNNQITLGDNSLLIIDQGSNNIVAGGNSDNIWDYDTNGTITATNSAINVNRAGVMDAVSGVGNIVDVYQGGDTINASNTIFQLMSANISLAITGNSDTINLTQSGDTLDLSGASDTINLEASGETVNVRANTFNIGGAFSETINGDLNWISSSASGASLTVAGNCATVNIASDLVTFTSANDLETVNGNSDTIDLTQAGDTLDVTGAGNTINAGTGNTITLTGDTEYGSYNYVYLSSGTFNLSANSNSILNGSNNQVTVGNGSLLNVNSGNANTVSAGSSENIWTSGTNGTFSATNSTVTVNVAGATESVSGTGDTVAVYQSGDTINVSNSAVTFMTANIAATIVGANNTASITTSGDTLDLSGSGDNVTLSSGGTINLTNGTSLTVHGTGVTVSASNATIYEGNTSTVTVNGTGDTIVHLGVAPIVFDLNGDGLELTPVGASDIITTASNGALTRLGWVGPTDGILVTDRSGNGQYNSVQDISFTQDLAGAQTDLEGLAGWDTNGDGVINAQDAGWSKLKIWVDSNGDGVVESGELYSLAQLGITSINLTRTLTGVDPTDTSDSYDSATSTFTRSDGSTGTTYDVTLGQQVLAAPGWQSSTASTWGPLTNLGQIGALSNAQAARLGTTTAGDINYTGINGLDPATAAIWSDFLTPAADAARKAAQATGQIGDTSWMQSSSVSVTDPNRGATNVTTQRFQVLDLDLTGAGPTTVESAASGVKLDVNLTGTPYSTGWVGPSDGLLVVDAADDGNIDAATEATFQSWVPYAKTSLQGLAAFDTNGDGMIDAGDAVFNNLRIWTDGNGDGVSEPGELQSLSQLGIQSISLKSDTATVDDKQLDENEILTTSTVTMVDGTTRTLYDIALGVDTGQDTSSPTSPTTPASTPVPASDPSSGLAAASDASAAAASTTTPSDTLHTPLNSASAGVSAASAGSAGPSGDVVVADEANASTTNGWWDNSSGQNLSDAINSFNAPSHATNASGAPTTEAIDAAMIQRHLLLRQAIAGFTIQGSAPAVFARQGSLDTQATLAAATTSQTVTSPASIPAGIAA